MSTAILMDVFRLIWVNPNFQKSDLALDYLNLMILKEMMVLYRYHEKRQELAYSALV